MTIFHSVNVFPDGALVILEDVDGVRQKRGIAPGSSVVNEHQMVKDIAAAIWV